MKSIHEYTSITEGLLLASSYYKNGFINKSTYNKCMLNNLTFLLNIIGEINNEITKEKKEKNSLINRTQVFSNPMTDVVLPMSSISYTMELQINTNLSDNKCNSKNKKFLFNKNENKYNIKNSTDNIDSLFEIQFEQTPIHSLIQTPFNNSMKINIFDFDKDEIFDTFFIPPPTSNRNGITNNSNNNFIDHNRFNSQISLSCNNGTEPKKFLSEELIVDFNLSDKKIESSYINNFSQLIEHDFNEHKEHELFDSNNFSKERIKSYSSLNHLFTKGRLTITNKNNSTNNKDKANIIIENALKEFSLQLPKSTIKTYVENMNITYLRLMKAHFSKLKEQSEFALDCENQLMLNLFKQLIFEIGLSDKTIVDLILRNIIYSDNNFSFNEFLGSFNKLLKMQDIYNFTKFKFLLFITRTENEKDITKKHFKKFLNLIGSKIIYDKEIVDNITMNFLHRYNQIFPGKSLVKINYINAILVLESFFENNE